jgi:Uncharacterized conserved protein, contains double-stranded beta-helix domain
MEIGDFAGLQTGRPVLLRAARANKLACVVPGGREYWPSAQIVRKSSERTKRRDKNVRDLSVIALGTERRPFYLAVVAGLACALVIGKVLPSTMDAISANYRTVMREQRSRRLHARYRRADLIARAAERAGKRVTIVRVFYGPGGFTRAHRHAGSVTAYITKGEIRSQLAGGAVEIFKVGQSFFEPPGAVHLVSANASNTEPAELIAVFVADEGAS